MPVPVQEMTPLGEAKVSPSGRMRVHAITAGVGSSGYYSPEVLQEAADNKLIAKGTPLFFDHPSESDRFDRPGRSVRDIAAVFTDAATYDAAEQALVGDIQVFSPYRDLLTEMGPHIGLSISGSATDVTEGEVDGNRVPVVEGLAAIDSVDWVTRAGRGGKVVGLLESARVNKRALGRGISEATVNDTRSALDNLLKDAYGGDKTWVYVQDFDDKNVWFQVDDSGDSGTFGQPYSTDANGVVALTGDRTEVRVVTTYVPTTRSDSTNTTTQESEEDTMPNIEESELARLREADGRVPTLTTERDTAVQERDEARRELAEARARDGAATHARTRVTEANATLPTAAVDRIVAAATATIPLTEAGVLDEAALDTAVDAARTAEEKYLATLVESTGGGLTGFGESAKDGEVVESKPTTTPWGRPLTVKGA